ncbi:MAG: glutamate-5-semialdehyde dehydrogenase [Spirochaetales bacterium]
MTVSDQVSSARRAAYRLAVVPEQTRNAILLAMADLLGGEQRSILEANERDAAAARESNLAGPLYKRLVLSESKLGVMAQSLQSVVDLPDPIGREEVRRELDEGLILTKVRVPIGVVGVIFESRPDALVQIASLAVKSGNAAILKGGREATETNRALHALFVRAIDQVSPDLTGALQLVETREDIRAVLELDDQIDLMIPRGSNQLVRSIQQNTRIPVLGHADGICHLYVHGDADEPTAVAIAKDAKTQYPAVCNAIETLLVHADAAAMLPAIAASMPEVELRGCDRTRRVIDIKPADEDDWSTEYNDLVLSIRIVDSLEQAVEHINRYGSHHTDAIVTSSRSVADRFLREVDSSSVLWNASTRFADGFRYGLGAEVGISTGKVHARGPVGLDGLTTTQYRVVGSGHIVADYAEGTRRFTHRELT